MADESITSEDGATVVHVTFAADGNVWLEKGDCMIELDRKQMDRLIAVCCDHLERA